MSDKSSGNDKKIPKFIDQNQKLAQKELIGYKELPKPDPQDQGRYYRLEGQYGPYILDEPGLALVHAANTAIELERPLLLMGEPGCGKSDFAWVAAKALGSDKPLRFHVRSDTRAKDLLYHYDALVRFADAQAGDKDKARDPRNYISLRPLGAGLMLKGKTVPVVLIDEIDKAPRDLPNDLLHEMDEGSFEIPEIGHESEQSKVSDGKYKIELRREMSRPQGQRKPLVVITSNAERQLPEAFLRRCIFYHFPQSNNKHLFRITQERSNFWSEQQPKGSSLPFFARSDTAQETSLKNMVEIVSHFRKDGRLVKKPSIAEMLDWIKALTCHYDFNLELDKDLGVWAQQLPEKKHWRDIPGIACLLKMAEDLQ